ncbi:DUF4411 family protein [Fimbriimonadia bacterium ATM]|nr:MAG: DUF4411 family protein [Armatimonadota bacterium]MBC6970657.1 DUF4411 family protein [Armatimonadota bacterium]MCE7899602.1 DUF4411 family protein [Armatimonadetes bacterium ATM1]MDL1927688.1 DUF4411 family protein [Fimbriimonadia bacterium ATM]RIJ96385.1 MAG: DUF4411 domain-containing protein [Armatimonadota bacterium]
MRYLLDANIFIEAKNLFYRFAVCPGFWDWLAQANVDGVVFSVDQVRTDLLVGTDDLAIWASHQTAAFFLPVDGAVTKATVPVSAWVQGQPFADAAKAAFFASSDYWLIAHALAYGFVVVTRETPDPKSRRRVKIPDVCRAVGVNFTNPFDMLESEGARFVL